MRARQSNHPDSDRILTVPMLADYLFCHPNTVYRLARARTIPAFRVGSDWRFRKSAVDRWLASGARPIRQRIPNRLAFWFQHSPMREHQL